MAANDTFEKKKKLITEIGEEWVKLMDLLANVELVRPEARYEVRDQMVLKLKAAQETIDEKLGQVRALLYMGAPPSVSSTTPRNSDLQFVTRPLLPMVEPKVRNWEFPTMEDPRVSPASQPDFSHWKPVSIERFKSHHFITPMSPDVIPRRPQGYQFPENQQIGFSRAESDETDSATDDYDSENDEFPPLEEVSS